MQLLLSLLAPQGMPLPLTKYVALPHTDFLLRSAATATISSSGRVHTFGCGKHSMLGHGDSVDAPNQDTPRVVAGLPAGTVVTQVAVGGMHMLALDSAGAVWSWGAAGRNSPVGRAGATAPGSPGKVGGALAGKTVTHVAAGRRHSLALTSDGEVYAWGGGHYGALATGGRRDVGEPTLVPGLRAPVVGIAAGSDHSLFLLSTGAVMAAGSDDYGQCGVGFKNRFEREAVQVPGLDSKNIVKVRPHIEDSHQHRFVPLCVCVCVVMIAFSR